MRKNYTIYVFIAYSRYSNFVNIFLILVNILLGFFEVFKYFSNLNIFFTGLITVLIFRRLFFRLRIFCFNYFYSKKWPAAVCSGVLILKIEY